MWIFHLLRGAVLEFLDDECPNMAAALSYYVVFALPPLLVLLLVLLGTVIDPAEASRHIQEQFVALIGPGVAGQIEEVLAQAVRPGAGRGATALLGAGALLFGATGAFVQLQKSLNRAWDVRPDPGQGGVRRFLLKRLLSLGMVMGIAFLLLVSLALSALLAAFGDVFASALSSGVSDTIIRVVDTAISFAVFALLFAAMFRFLPDARIAWRQVWVGAIATTLLFVVGKLLIGVYLGNVDPGRAYGAAGSLAVLLLWIYYTSMILLFGAEFTQASAERKGRVVQAQPGAVRAEAHDRSKKRRE